MCSDPDSRARVPIPRDPAPRSRRAAPWRGLLALPLIAALGCGDGAPEEKLVEAREQLEERRADVADLLEQVEEKRAEVTEAEATLEQARKELRTATLELAEARRAIRETATDVALFRSIQAALLSNEALEDVAIRVEVDEDVVTLHGEVRNAEQAQAALRTARDTPGVVQVISRLRLPESDDASDSP